MNKFKVLIVDDRPENLLALEAILEELNLDLIRANSGNEALSLLLEHEIAIVLLDVQMPEMDGFEVAELMKMNERTKFIPIIFITAISNEDRYKYKAYHMGAVDYILKPIIPEILVSKVKVFIELYEQKEKIRQQAVALEEANMKLRNLSYLDGLTGIPNRRRLDLYFQQIWQSAIKMTHQLSIIIIDIDFFKLYNDYYGHVQGDECLKVVAQSLDQTISETNYFLSRYGGEEFIVIMPKTDLLNAEEFAHKLCITIKQLEIEHKKSTISPFVTISAGIASSIIEDGMTPESLISKADQALYKAKDLGRCTVVAY